MIKLILFGTLVANVILVSIASPTSTDGDDGNNPPPPQQCDEWNNPPPSKRKCKKNERYAECPIAMCEPQTCDELGYPVPCPGIGPDGTCPGEPGCICIAGYVRNKKGKCVPKKQCPSCGGDSNAESGCGQNCGRRCSNYKDRNVVCPLICEVNGCDCKEDYVYDDNTKKCVFPKDCTNCDDNEFRNTCPPQKCDAEYCPKTRDSPQTCVSPKTCGKPRCTCNFNHKRDWETGKCIPIADCPPFECCGPNEEYQSCPPRCPGQNCTDYINKTTCPKYKIGIVVPCEPKCRCKDGYYRNSKNICIEACECEKDNNNPDNNNPGSNNPGNNNPGNHNPGNNVNSTEVMTKFNLGLADFSSKFLSTLVKKNPGKSVFHSALSVDFPLGQLTLYAEGSSLDELLKLLNLANKDEVRSAFKTALSEIKSNNVTMDIANKVYMNSEYQLSDAFIKDSTEVFNAPAEEIDVSDAQKAADIINKWVEAQTNGRIKNLIPASAITTLTKLILVNAIYFKGDWKYPFAETNTQDQDFYVTPDKTVKVPMMYQKNKFLYAESQELQAQVIELRYIDEDIRMIILLPLENDGLQGVLDRLNGNTLLKAINSLVRTEVKVYLPKFKIETSMELIEILKTCGITKIFEPSESGLNGILKQPAKLAVTAAVQKAFLEVNEKGSEAAAATGIIVGTTSVGPKQIVFNANRPFVLHIIRKNTILFSGACQDFE